MSAQPDSGRQRETQRLAAALAHARHTVDALLTETAGGAEEGFFTRTKLAAETSLLLYAAHRVQAEPDLTPTIDAIATRLCAAARSPELLTWVRLRPHLLPELSVAHLVLTRLGHVDEPFAQALVDAAGTCSVDPVERLPWKQIERTWQHQMGAPGAGEPLTPSVAHTALAARQDALFATREEVYSFTHALIYHTDFGTRLPPLPRPAAALAEDASSALARCLDEDDFDLAAELLFTWPYTRQPWGPTAVFALRVLRAVDDELGFLPSMTLDADRHAELDASAARRYFLRESYHTVYVMGLLSAASLAPGVDPAPELSAPSARVSLADELWDLMPPPLQERRWPAVLQRLDAAQRAALCPMLADIGVRRAIRQGDFRRARDIITTVSDADLPLTPALQQAAEVLVRLAAGTHA